MTDYNGWTNKETWLVRLWIDNDQGSQEFWLDQARRSINKAPRNEFSASRKQERRIWLAEQLKDWHESAVEDAMPKRSSVFDDLMNCALGAVNWHEIAGALLSDAGKIEGE